MSNHKNCNISFFFFFPHTGFLLYFLSKRGKIFFLIHKSCSVITERLASLCNSSCFCKSFKFRGKNKTHNKTSQQLPWVDWNPFTCPAATSSGKPSPLAAAAPRELWAGLDLEFPAGTWGYSLLLPGCSANMAWCSRYQIPWCSPAGTRRRSVGHSIRLAGGQTGPTHVMPVSSLVLFVLSTTSHPN